MEENLILENNPVEQPKRSQFLKVLCILSFIMCGFTFLSGIWGIYQSTPEAMQKNVEQIRGLNPEMADQMENQMIEMQSNAFSKISPYLGLIYTLISFLGVMMMWNRVRKGFYIYAVAEILPYTSMLFVSQGAMKMPGLPAGAMMVVMVLMVAVDLLFVFLYSRNLKEMTK